jgi:hypothetical protein
MNMTTLNSEIHELNTEDLDNVAGGMPFYGMGCSAHQSETIGGIVDGLRSIPFVGGYLADMATGLGRLYCS